MEVEGGLIKTMISTVNLLSTKPKNISLNKPIPKRDQRGFKQRERKRRKKKENELIIKKPIDNLRKQNKNKLKTREYQTRIPTLKIKP